jgi:hypothetical protein
MQTRKPNLILPVVAGLAVLLGVYIVAYYAMVRPRTDKFMNMIGASLLVINPRYGPFDGGEGGVAKHVFAPLHWLDRRMRPRTWGGPIPTKEELDAFQRSGLPSSIKIWDFSKGPPW